MTTLSRTALTTCASAGAVIALVGLGLAAAAPAQAHGIIDLGGVDAIAGHSSTMTLEIQHGCITKATGTVQVQAFVGRPWGRVVPRPVAGWTVRTQRLDSGVRQITWTKQGDPQPFSTPAYFPLKVTWPTTPGVYSMKVTQACPDDITTWGTPGGPATGDAPSPPLTPIPQVQVLPAD